MAGSHTPFALVNRAVNPLVRGLLRSPAHGLVSSRLALLTVTGRRSGRTFTFPVGYRRDGDRVTIGVDWPERKRWWRNLLDAAPVEIWLAGVRRTGTGEAHGDEHTGVTVEIQLNGAARPAADTGKAPA
jgi:F420H(2)-dependent quinone reductase